MIGEFTHQAESFNQSAVMRSADTLDVLGDALPATPGDRWIDIACGPGLGDARDGHGRVGEAVAGVDPDAGDGRGRPAGGLLQRRPHDLTLQRWATPPLLTPRTRASTAR